MEKNENKESFSSKLKKYMKNLFNFSQYSAKTIIYIFLFVALIVISLGLVWYIYLGGGETLLLTLVVERFINPIYTLGIFGFLLFFIVMAIQGLIVPIPSELVLLAAGMIWGFIGGGIMGVIGSMAAALLCFYVSRKGGRPLAEKFVGKSAISMADDFIHKYGMSAIIIARLLPFVAFDPISYTAGLVDLDVKKYSVGTLIGSIPRAFFYSWIGASLTTAITFPLNITDLPEGEIEALSANFNNILLIVLGVLILIFITYYFISKNYEKKKLKDNT
ncbi:MAG: TVP38/TMEM64 family protein [Candidatus Lokiarchaeota archaeon]|nr:TVP38/TMEM64 family protein [Candidatus Lokiarchaeota archaeon]